MYSNQCCALKLLLEKYVNKILQDTIVVTASGNV